MESDINGAARMMVGDAPAPFTATGWEGTVVNDANGNTLALMPGANYGLSTVKQLADLFAAAPDLLAALEMAQETLDALANGWDESEVSRQEMADWAATVAMSSRAAIAKARQGGGA